MNTVLRIKRKACNEPVEGLVIALKKSKSDVSTSENEVFFKFAATVRSETECIKDHIQAALTRENSLKYSQYRNPKSVGQKNASDICQKLKKENRAASNKKRLDLLNNRRLIFSETVPIVEDEGSVSQDLEVRQLFQLYDIIEENEDIKKQGEGGTTSSITCNGVVLEREKSEGYVYDVYISNVGIDESFTKNAICVRPYTKVLEDDIYTGSSSDSEECNEEDDDSNDENNWRNDYPDESDSDRDSAASDGDYDYTGEMRQALDHFNIDEDASDDETLGPFDYSRVLKELQNSNSEED